MSGLRPPSDLIARFQRDLEALTGAAPTHLGVAVSGGPDSLALLLLAHGALPERVQAATVDHGLRPESAGEARFVARLCGTLGVAHAILDVSVATDRPSLQRAAREARYRALADWLQANGIPWLATAHHVEDQAETVMMRLLRGVGVGGLAGVRRSNALPVGEARLIRPLLDWRRAELAALVEAAGIEAVADPSNLDARFDRIRIRRELAETEWIDPAALARSAAALAEADAALDWAADRAWREHVQADGAAIRFDPADLPAELRRRLVLRAVRRLAPDAAPRGEEVSRLIATLETGGTATLAGIRCSAPGAWHFVPAPPRRKN